MNVKILWKSFFYLLFIFIIRDVLLYHSQNFSTSLPYSNYSESSLAWPVFLHILTSPCRWAYKKLVWSALICQGFQWCYLFMNSQQMNPPGHVSTECAGGTVTLSPTSKWAEPPQNVQQNPYRTTKVGRGAAPGSVVSEITPAAQLCIRDAIFTVSVE